MEPVRPLRELFSLLSDSRSDAVADDSPVHPQDLLDVHGYGDLPPELLAEAIVSFAGTAPVEVAEHLASFVTEHSGIPGWDDGGALGDALGEFGSDAADGLALLAGLVDDPLAGLGDAQQVLDVLDGPAMDDRPAAVDHEGLDSSEAPAVQHGEPGATEQPDQVSADHDDPWAQAPATRRPSDLDHDSDLGSDRDLDLDGDAGHDPFADQLQTPVAEDPFAAALDVPDEPDGGLGHEGLGHEGLGHEGLGHDGLGHDALGHEAFDDGYLDLPADDDPLDLPD